MTKEQILEYFKDINLMYNESTRYDDLSRMIDELEPKTGHWIIIDDCELFMAKCSECGKIVDSRVISQYPYCHCGAKME